MDSLALRGGMWGHGTSFVPWVCAVGKFHAHGIGKHAVECGAGDFGGPNAFRWVGAEACAADDRSGDLSLPKNLG